MKNARTCPEAVSKLFLMGYQPQKDTATNQEDKFCVISCDLAVKVLFNFEFSNSFLELNKKACRLKQQNYSDIKRGFYVLKKLTTSIF